MNVIDEITYISKTCDINIDDINEIHGFEIRKKEKSVTTTNHGWRIVTHDFIVIDYNDRWYKFDNNYNSNEQMICHFHNKGFTQYEISQIMNISQATISKILRRKYNGELH